MGEIFEGADLIDAIAVDAEGYKQELLDGGRAYIENRIKEWSSVLDRNPETRELLVYGKPLSECTAAVLVFYLMRRREEYIRGLNENGQLGNRDLFYTRRTF